jgi:protein SCO1
MRYVLLLALLLLGVSDVRAQRVMNYGKAPAEPAREPNLPAIGIDQRLGEQVPLDLVFRDEHNQETTLGSCVAGKPTILVLAYYRCPMLCNQVLNGLVESMRKLPWDVGDKFNVICVSFDPKDKPGIASAKKNSYLTEYGRPGAEKGWHFLTGEQSAIDSLCQAVGFRYEYDKVKKQYNHASGIMVMTPYGKLSRYFYGIKYDENIDDLKTAIEEASGNKIGKEVDPGSVLQFLCYEYNPVTGQYTLSVMKGLRVVFGIMVLGLGFWLIRVWRRPPNLGQSAPDSHASA